VGLLRFNYAKAAFNGASKLVVTPFGRWKLSIVLIRICIVAGDIIETVLERSLPTYTLPVLWLTAIPRGALPTVNVSVT
jgi:hypothetical protein